MISLSIKYVSVWGVDQQLILYPLTSCFRADHLTFCLSIPWPSYFRADRSILHSLASYFRSIRLSLWRVIFAPSIPWPSYFRADHIILHPSILLRVIFVLSIPWASYFRTYHLILHSLASYFCALHSLGELFSCLPFNSPFVHPFGELFSCRIFNSPFFYPSGGLFLSTV